MISIQSKTCLRGTATKFDVANVVYSPSGAASANALLLGSDNKIIDSLVVEATPEQTALWGPDKQTDDQFYAVLATNAGLTPV